MQPAPLQVWRAALSAGARRIGRSGLAGLSALAAASLLLTACQPANPPPTPLPTKEKTIDKVKSDIDNAMKQAEQLRQEADRREADDPTKKGS